MQGGTGWSPPARAPSSLPRRPLRRLPTRPALCLCPCATCRSTGRPCLRLCAALFPAPAPYTFLIPAETPRVTASLNQQCLERRQCLRPLQQTAANCGRPAVTARLTQTTLPPVTSWHARASLHLDCWRAPRNNFPARSGLSSVRALHCGSKAVELYCYSGGRGPSRRRPPVPRSR